MKMNPTRLVALCLLSWPLFAQTSPVITMDQEPHHHLAFKNDQAEVFEVNLAVHDSFLMHRHDHDDVAVILGEGVTVSTTPGKADVLTNYKGGEVVFARSGRVHAVRNIGQTAYRMVSIDLLKPQTGARNLCGTQIPDSPASCPAPPAVDPNAPRSDVPQFETDQLRVTLATVRPHQTASFGDADRDELIVPMDDAVTGPPSGKGADLPLASGNPLWVAKGKTKHNLKNPGDKDLPVVIVAFQP